MLKPEPCSGAPHIPSKSPAENPDYPKGEGVQVTDFPQITCDHMASSSSTTVRGRQAPGLRRIGLVEADSQVVAEFRDLAGALDHGGWEFHSVSNGRAALTRLPGLAPQIVFIGTWHGRPTPLECVRSLAMAFPPTPLCILSSRAKDYNLSAAFNAGATGCLIRPVRPQAFKDAVASACEQRFFLCDAARELVFRDIRGGRQSLFPPLSKRERTVAGFLAEGLLEKEIADKLNLRAGTVHEYIQRIYHKLGVHRRTEVANVLMALQKSS